MKLFTGKNKDANSRKLAEMALADEHGLFITTNMNDLNDIKDQYPDLAGRTFLGNNLHHAVGRPETNLYVDNITNNKLNHDYAGQFNVVAASATTDEHEAVDESYEGDEKYKKQAEEKNEQENNEPAQGEANVPAQHPGEYTPASNEPGSEGGN